MVDIVCAPACAPNLATGLPDGPLAPVVRGDNCTIPLFVELCKTDFDKTILCTPDAASTKIVVVTTYTLAGVPTTTAYNLNGTVYAGDIALLVDCAGSTESDVVEWCQTIGTVRTTLTQWVVKATNGQPTGVTYWTNFTGAVVAAPLEANVTRGACGLDKTFVVEMACYRVSNVAVPFSAELVKAITPDGTIESAILYTKEGVLIPRVVGDSFTLGLCIPAVDLLGSGGAQIAGPTRALTPAFAGALATWSSDIIVVGTVQSITVMAKATVDGLPTLTTDQVRVLMSDGSTVALCAGEVRTWSVSRDGANALDREFTVTATGNAYATITFTRTF